MFSWKKQNPPSQRQQQQSSDYGDIIAQGMRLANEDINVDNDDMDDIVDEDIDDADLDDPELLAELHGLTSELSSVKPKPKAAPTQNQPVAKAPVPAAKPPTRVVPPQQHPQPVATPPASKAQTQASNPASAAPSSLADLGVDIDGIMKDDDDEEVELTEDDWKDPHLLAQLQLLGGHGEQDLGTPTKPTPSQKNTINHPVAQSSSQTSADPPIIEHPSPKSTYSSQEHKLASASSSMIAIPPKDKAYIDDLDEDSIMTEQDEIPTISEPSPVPSSKALPQKPKEIAKKNDPELLKLLKLRHAQFKRAALNAGRLKNNEQLRFYVSKYKMLQLWINKVESGEYLDPTLFTVPDEPPNVTTGTEDVDMPAASTAVSSPVARSARSTAQNSELSAPHISSTGITAQDQLSEAASSPTTSARGLEIKQLSKFDDFHIISNSNDDTYDMLQSQLESQIAACTTAYRYYYTKGEVQTALKFRKLQKSFQNDLSSLQSYRSHDKPAPAFHFQDVRYQLEIGYNDEIGVNDLSLNIIKAWDLSHKEVQPSDIEPYVVYDLGWPTENMPGAGTGKGTTPTVKRSNKPEFNFSKTLGIQRTTAFQRFVDKKKLTLEVWHYRGLLWKDYFIGRAQVPLSALMGHSEIHEVVPLLDPNNRRSTGGKIEVKIQLKEPLLHPEIVIKEEKWLVIDEFNSHGVEFPAPLSTGVQSGAASTSARRTPLGTSKAATTSSSRTLISPATTRPVAPDSKPVLSKQPVASPKQPVASPKQAAPARASLAPANNSRVASATSTAPKPSTPAAKAPAAKAPAAKAPAAAVSSASGEPDESESEKALNELNNVDLLVSNVVLEYEIQRAKAMMEEAQNKGNNDAVEEYQDRLSQLEIKMQLLVIKVQTGQLTMDGYCQSVNERIKKDKKLAITLKHLGMTSEAMVALARSKKMEGEMKEVEEAMAAQGGGGDE